MGDFNQAISVMEAKLQEALGGVSVSLDTSRAGDHEDCIAIYCVGQGANIFDHGAWHPKGNQTITSWSVCVRGCVCVYVCTCIRFGVNPIM